MKQTIYIHALIHCDGRTEFYICSHSMDGYHSSYTSYTLLETREIDVDDLPDNVADVRVEWLKSRRAELLGGHTQEVEKIDDELAQWQGVEV